MRHRTHTQCERVLSSMAWLSCLLVNACSMSAGATATHAFALSERAVGSTHVGAAGEAYLHVPRTNGLIVGAQAAILGQVEPTTYSDQWRAAGAVGYGQLPEGDHWAPGFEAIGHVGYLRGQMGRVSGPGALHAGLRLGLPLPIRPGQVSWKRDGALQPLLLVVPQVGAGPVYAWNPHGPNQLFLEPFFALNLRLHVSSSLVP